MYIAFEGIVGAGKSTQVKRLVEYFRTQGKNVIQVREPGSTPIAEDIRHLAQGKEWENEEMHPLTNAYLYAAARAQTLQTIVKPALQRRDIVISDRCFLSSCVIQWEAQWLGIETVLEINTEAIKGILPDIIFYLDIDIDLALSRTFDIWGDKFEKEGRDFYEKITLWYAKCETLDIVKGKFVKIDANKDEEAVFQQILSLIEAKIWR